MIKGPSRYSMGNPKVFISGLPGVSLGCPTSGNNMSAPLGAAPIPSVPNVFLSDASATRPLRGEEPPALKPDPEASWGWLSLRQLTAHSAASLAEALETAEAERFVVDLRGNPGGPLDAARRVLEELLPHGAHLFTRHEADGDEVAVRSRHEGRGQPRLAVLVDGATASAAEVVVAALRHHRRALIVARRTMAKAPYRWGAIHHAVGLCASG